MNNLDNDSLTLIFNYLDDCYFVRMIHTAKKFMSLSKYKPVTKQYHISKIYHISQKYEFTNIYYDLIEWNPGVIPLSIQQITFCDYFNSNIHELFKFSELKKINIGMFYTNRELLENDLPTKLNIDEIVKTFIINKIFYDDMKNEINVLQGIHVDPFSSKIPDHYNGGGLAQRCEHIVSEYKKYSKDNKLNEIENHIIMSAREFNKRMNITSNYEKKYYISDSTEISDDQLGFIIFYGYLMEKYLNKIVNDMIIPKYGTLGNFKEVCQTIYL